jgi:hypothetical protein
MCTARPHMAERACVDRRHDSGPWAANRHGSAPQHRSRQHAGLHQLSSRSQPEPLVLSRQLLVLLVARLVPNGPVVIGIDDTLERRWGRRIQARGIYRDPVRSSHGHFVKASGLRWLSTMLLVPVPWAGRAWALPFLTALVPSERHTRKHGRRHKKLTDWARQLVLQTARWLPGRKVIAVADSSYAAIDLLNVLRRRVCVITRLRLDARLFAPPPPRTPHTRGRPRVIGERLPTLAKRLADPRTRWRCLKVTGWYGQAERSIEIVTGTAIWHHPGRWVPIRYVLVRDVEGKFRPQAFLCTDVNADPLDILAWFVRRWCTEVTFAEVRRHLGVETQRQWSEAAIARTTPVLLALFSLVTLWADDLQGQDRRPMRSGPWYRKSHPTFSDALAAVRRSLWFDICCTSQASREVVKVPRAAFDRLTSLACYPA